MLRNLLAIIVATVAGLAIAKFIEGLIGGGVAPGEAAAGREIAGLAVGYLVGAFIAATLAMLIGRRWAPLGWLGAATIGFAAVITLMSFNLPWVLWPLSAAACAAGGWGSIKLLKAQYQLPNAKPKETLFDD